MDFQASQLLFKSMDTNSDGLINMMDLAMGLRISLQEAARRMQNAGYAATSMMDLGAFLQVMAMGQHDSSAALQTPSPPFQPTAQPWNSSMGWPPASSTSATPPLQPTAAPPLTAYEFAKRGPSSALHTVSDDCLAEFKTLDSDHDGYISSLEFAAAISSLGYSMSLRDAVDLFHKAGCPSTGIIDVFIFAKLRELMEERYPDGPLPGTVTSESSSRPASQPGTQTSCPDEELIATVERDMISENFQGLTASPSAASPQPATSPRTPSRLEPFDGDLPLPGSPLPGQSRRAPPIDSGSPHPQELWTLNGETPIITLPPGRGRGIDPNGEGSFIGAPDHLQLRRPDRAPASFESALASEPVPSLPSTSYDETEWIDTNKGFLYKNIHERPEGIYFMEGGVRLVMENFPRDVSMVTTYSNTLGCYVIVRRK